MDFETGTSGSWEDEVTRDGGRGWDGPAAAAMGAGHVLAFDADTGVPADVPLGMSLLAALEEAAQETVAIGCRNGGCGVCRIRILSGSYSKGKMSRKFVTVDDERERIALACRVYPTSGLIYRREPRDR